MVFISEVSGKAHENEIRQKLVELGSDRLAELILEIASNDGAMKERIERLVAGPAEKVARFKSRLKALSRRSRFIDWREAGVLAAELSGLVDDLGSAIQDPKEGLVLVAQFFEKDTAVFEKCDDSGGGLGMVFNYNARNVFARFARECKNPDWVADLVFKLYSRDSYGVRGAAVQAAAEALPAECVRKLAATLQAEARRLREDHSSRHYFIGAEILAKGIKDPKLLEAIKRESDHELHEHSCMEVARLYLEAGEPQPALEWLARTEGSDFLAQERDGMLRSIYEKLGNREKLEEVAWRQFCSDRCHETFRQLLEVIGEDQRDRVVQQETQAILANSQFNVRDAQFLLDVECVPHAEAYVIAHVEKLDGDDYPNLLPLAKAFQGAGCVLPTVLVYRALVDSILARGKSKYYHHGARYLNELSTLSETVSKWKQFPSHQVYVQRLKKQHGRKVAFWSR